MNDIDPKFGLSITLEKEFRCGECGKTVAPWSPVGMLGSQASSCLRLLCVPCLLQKAREFAPVMKEREAARARDRHHAE